MLPQVLLDSFKRQYYKSNIIKNRVDEMYEDGTMTQDEYDYIIKE